MLYNVIDSMKEKKARYIYQAIRDWNTTITDIVQYVKDNLRVFISDVHIRHIVNCMDMKGYIGSKKVGKYNEWYIKKEISGQIDIKL